MDNAKCYYGLLDHEFLFIYARTMHKNIEKVTREQCYGCQIDHPLQTQHPCIMWCEEEKLTNYFTEIMASVNEEEVLQQWSDNVERLDVPPYFLAMYKLKLFCDDWRATEMKSGGWNDRLYNHVSQLIRLEERFH